MIVFPNNGAGLDFSFDFTVQLNLDIADFGKLQPVPLDFEPALWIGKTVISVLALKLGEAWLFALFQSAEEALIRFIQAFENVLY